MTPAPDLPDKLYFKIGEVARLVGVKPYVLRYWETEFRVLKPEKSETRHRLYRRRDVEMLLLIRRLLHDERYTIEGAKRRLRQGVEEVAATPQTPSDVMARVRLELLDLCRQLERDPSVEPPPLRIGTPD
ncbi:MAG TPA: MerR family transcriptional regulator [Candidatus Binatia bacterium]|jgi:DNA-binding transcriptional MerR regulator|nr:MerR family transcriptional regulator [Candidatus Binatia bacterium]